MSNRIHKREYYLGIAEAVSKRSTCLRRRYGAVIVKNDEIVATGYNGSPRGEVNCCDVGICHRVNCEHNDGNYVACPAVHAEQNAIISASRAELLSSTLYLYGYDCEFEENIKATPCALCERMIKNSGIERVIVSKESEFKK